MTGDVGTSTPRSQRLIALSQLSCVVLFGVLLVWPPQSTSLALGVGFVVLCASFAATLLASVARRAERREGALLQQRMSDEQAVKQSLEERVLQRTRELDDAQRVLHRMWWLGQQITLELNPRRVLDRFLEAAADVAQADGAALGLLASDGTIEVAAASGSLSALAGLRIPVNASAMGHVIRAGGSWSVEDASAHVDLVHPSWFERVDPPLRGMAVLPVQRRGDRIGAVTIASQRTRAFTSLELKRVEAMADLLSVALANAELFESMRQAEWRFRTLFRAAPDAVLTVLQTTGRVREANDAVREVFGVEPHQIVGRQFSDMIAPNDRSILEVAIGKAHAGQPARVEVRIVTPAGESRVVALAASRLPEADPPSVLLVGRDMTQEREMRVRLMESDRLAAVGELVAGVAHEVNNPLSSISAFAQLLLRDSDLSPPQRESIEVIRGETIRASQVVKDLLAFARRSDPQNAPLDLNAVIARTLRMRQYQFNEASVRVETDLAADLASVIGDARQLQQVCLNLMTNAVQAMTPGGGVMHVSTRQDGELVLLEVRDTGPGISIETRAHIFEPFFTTKEEGEGTGLGLSVSYGIVKSHGGTIVVVDSDTPGTTFRVALPAASAHAPVSEGEQPGASAPLRSPLAGIKLLFVDDEPALRAGMHAFGEMRGFTVLTAADGLSALQTARTTGVDAVVCDLRMPQMDGHQFHQHLERERPGLALRTVFITGDVIAPAVVRGSVARQPVLTKPFSFDKLEEALIGVMRGRP